MTRSSPAHEFAVGALAAKTHMFVIAVRSKPIGPFIEVHADGYALRLCWVRGSWSFLRWIPSFYGFCDFCIRTVWLQVVNRVTIGAPAVPY